MNETAAYFVDDVLPHVPVRQWVLSVLHWLRYAMAHDAALTSVVCKEFLSAVKRWLRWRLRKQKVRKLLKTGAATAIQRFDSALALNVHFHALVLDGAYSLDASGQPQFHAVAAPEVANSPPKIGTGTCCTVAARQIRCKASCVDEESRLARRLHISVNTCKSDKNSTPHAASLRCLRPS